MAYSSLLEVLNQLLISVDLNWVTEAQLTESRHDIEVISAKINSLRKAALQRQTNTK